jgi:hypothetical protein
MLSLLPTQNIRIGLAQLTAPGKDADDFARAQNKNICL